MRRTVLFALMLMALLSFTAMAQRGEVNYTPKQTEFRTITLPQAQAVTLRLYEAGLGGKAYKTVKMKGKKSADHTLWSATVKGNLNGKFYTFEVTQGGKKLGECAGVFARAVGVNGQRGAVIDFAATNPDGWSRDLD